MKGQTSGCLNDYLLETDKFQKQLPKKGEVNCIIAAHSDRASFKIHLQQLELFYLPIYKSCLWKFKLESL